MIGDLLLHALRNPALALGYTALVGFNGLTQGADHAANACLLRGGDARSCSPRYDWK